MYCLHFSVTDRGDQYATFKKMKSKNKLNKIRYRVPTQPGKREKSVKLNIAPPALEKSLN